MKIADKIKYVLKHNPEIASRKAVYNAMGYLKKHNPTMIIRNFSCSDANALIVELHGPINSYIVMPNLSTYPIPEESKE